MIFSEIYGVYYKAVADILNLTVKGKLTKTDMRECVMKYGFSESLLRIEPAIFEEQWKLVKKDGTSPIKHSPTMPLTLLQKRWLKSILQDPRMKLFDYEAPELEEIEPLFMPEDICVFDQYSTGDSYEDERYIENFKLIMHAIKNQYPISIETLNRKGNLIYVNVLPKYLEYSAKDDRFRLITGGNRFGNIINLGRIISCRPCPENIREDKAQKENSVIKTVEFELMDKRNALERVLFHFSHLKKQAERLDTGKYRVQIEYDAKDELELVIRILSFGSSIRVTAPQNFVSLIKKRLIQQKSCEL